MGSFPAVHQYLVTSITKHTVLYEVTIINSSLSFVVLILGPLLVKYLGHKVEEVEVYLVELVLLVLLITTIYAEHDLSGIIGFEPKCSRIHHI